MRRSRSNASFSRRKSAQSGLPAPNFQILLLRLRRSLWDGERYRVRTLRRNDCRHGAGGITGHRPARASRELGAESQPCRSSRTAKQYLRSTGAFDTKIGGDLLRTSIDVAHRALVAEIENIKCTPYAGRQQDSERRVYLRTVGIMTLAEEKLFSAIYTYISENPRTSLMR